MPWEYDANHSIIELGSRHLGLAMIKGRFKKAEVTLVLDDANPESSSIDATIDATSIDTDLDRRDAQLRGEAYLDIEHHPTISFKSRRIESRAGRYGVVGDLTIRGVTRVVELDAAFNGEATDARGVTRRGFSATARVARADFGIKGEQLPGGAAIGLSDDVFITLEVETIKRD